MNLDDYAGNKRVKVLVYGPPKSGKTALVGELAAHGMHLHWLDLEQGIKTLLNPEILPVAHRKNVSVINIPDHRTYPIAITTVRDILKSGGPKEICVTHGKIACPACKKDGRAFTTLDLTKFTDKDVLVIDSMSQLSRSAMAKAVLKEISKPGGEEYKPTYQDYMVQGALMEEILSFLQVVDLNVAVISHELESESLQGREKIVPVAGTRNFSLTVAKYFDSVVYTEVVNKRHTAQVASTYSPLIVTGSRLPVIFDTKEKPSLITLFNSK